MGPEDGGDDEHDGDVVPDIVESPEILVEDSLASLEIPVFEILQEDHSVLAVRPNWQKEIMQHLAQIVVHDNPTISNLKRHLKKLPAEQFPAIAELLHRVILEKHHFTGIHQQNVADIAKLLANRLNLPLEQIDVIYAGALIHDVGKMAIPFWLLDQKTPLTQAEIKFLQKHATEGHEFAYMLGFPDVIRDIIRHHHEKESGDGYPDKIFNISFAAKLVSLVDMICAQAENRPYDKPRESESIVQSLIDMRTHALKSGKNGLWPKSIDLCIDLIRSGDLLKRIRPF